MLLDVNGTLFSPSAAAPAFKELGLNETLVEVRIRRAHYESHPATSIAYCDAQVMTTWAHANATLDCLQKQVHNSTYDLQLPTRANGHD